MRFFTNLMAFTILALAGVGCIDSMSFDVRASFEGLKEVQAPTRSVDVKFFHLGEAVEYGKVAVTQLAKSDTATSPTRMYDIRWGYARITLVKGGVAELRLAYSGHVYQPILVTKDTSIYVDSLETEVR